MILVSTIQNHCLSGEEEIVSSRCIALFLSYDSSSKELPLKA
jgi:hypothetical protein